MAIIQTFIAKTWQDIGFDEINSAKRKTLAGKSIVCSWNQRVVRIIQKIFNLFNGRTIERNPTIFLVIQLLFLQMEQVI